MSETEKLIAWGWAAHRSGSWISNTFVRYKLTHERWRLFWSFQKGQCAGCLADLAHPLDRTIKVGLRPEVDHCHKTGVVRGLLCRRCNDFLGKLNDNREIMERLLKYLDRNGRLNDGVPKVQQQSSSVDSGNCNGDAKATSEGQAALDL